MTVAAIYWPLTFLSSTYCIMIVSRFKHPNYRRRLIAAKTFNKKAPRIVKVNWRTVTFRID